MPRKSVKSVTLKSTLQCMRVYPTEDSKKTIAGLKTVGLKLSREQAIDLARVLLTVSKDWEQIDLTAYRFDKNKEGTYYMTVTSMQPESK